VDSIIDGNIEVNEAKSVRITGNTVDGNLEIEEPLGYCREKLNQVSGDIEENEKIDKGIAEVQKKYKKHRLYEYKDEYCAILERIAGAEVAFIKAFSDLTREGYRLMAQDEGGSLNLGGIVSAGVNAYFYFQKIKYVTSDNS